jgi:hypothetical protein
MEPLPVSKQILMQPSGSLLGEHLLQALSSSRATSAIRWLQRDPWGRGPI